MEARVGYTPEIQYFRGGKLTVVGDKLAPKEEPTDPVAIHEARHSALGRVKSVSIVPGPGYLGITIPDGPINLLAAVAPHAGGSDGTSHDLNIVRMHGYNPDSLMGAARSELAANKDRINAIALGLQREKTLTSSGIERVVFEYNQANFTSATVLVESPQGEVREKKVPVRDNIAMIPQEITIFPTDGQNSKIH